jgi:hypothetical protein
MRGQFLDIEDGQAVCREQLDGCIEREVRKVFVIDRIEGEEIPA